MNLSRKWLNEFVTIDAQDKDFAEAMTLSGSKVEITVDTGAQLSNVVVGNITSMCHHENSDHMFICQVDVGTETVQIVTGAQNVSVGDFVPVAKDNSVLPDGTHITAGELRGVMSCGMLCSLKELALDLRDFPYALEDGIWIIDEPECVAGLDIRTIINGDDKVVEFEITSNRPDCLSVIGLARETAATYNKELRLHTPVVKGGAEGDLIQLLDVETPDAGLCPRYTARMVRNVTIAPSPRWMRERLRASGIRPINNIVDITNYVMLEYGQPMHAFDYRYVQGGKIIVRRATIGETLTTLDGTVRTLTPDMLVIADETRAVGLAGIMGGMHSEIVADTVDVVFESATFDGSTIRKTALALGMRTDASAKFEKGLDPMNALPAVQRACELVELLGAGQVVDGIIDMLNYVPHPTQLDLQAEKINALLGTKIPRDDMIRYLEKLDFIVEGERVTVPSYRADVSHYSDLAEEVARLFGYNNIPVSLMRGQIVKGGFTPSEQTERQLGATCRSLGYSEIITYSFISPTYYDKIRLSQDDSRRQSLRICNPLGEDTSIMRTTILPSMLDILTRNYNFRNKTARLYELGRTYFAKEDGLADEPKVLSLGGYGDMDFFSLKGAVESVLTFLRIENLSYHAVTENPSYHSGRCAEVRSGDTVLGVLGQIHPLVAQNYGVDESLYCAELSFSALLSVRGADPIYTPLPKFPTMTRDIAVVCDEAVTVGALQTAIKSGSLGLLQEVTLFDIYRGKGIDEGKKSVAFNLSFRSDSRSLTADEADSEVKSILIALNNQLGAILR